LQHIRRNRSPRPSAARTPASGFRSPMRRPSDRETRRAPARPSQS
jgi:hypothetical protein